LRSQPTRRARNSSVSRSDHPHRLTLARPSAAPMLRLTAKPPDTMLDLPHVAARVFGTPLLIARGKLDVILGVLAPRLTGAALIQGDGEREPAEQLSVTPS